MNATVGQVTPTRFVMRHYEESHVRARLVCFSDPSDTDKIAGHAVEWRIGDVTRVDPRWATRIFGDSHDQFVQALDAYLTGLVDYLNKGVLPS